MTFEGLPKEAISALLEKDKARSTYRSGVIISECESCGELLQNGYCISEDCTGNPYFGDKTQKCSVCGYCETPERCPWSLVCPVCSAGIGLMCKEGLRIVGLHKERHLAVTS